MMNLSAFRCGTLLGGLVLCGFVVGPLAAPAFGQTSSFSGFGRVFYEADSYDLSFAVVTENPDVAACKREHMAAVIAVDKFLQGQRGITSSLKRDAAGLQLLSLSSERRVYRFTTGYTARVTDANSLTAFQGGLIEAGVTQISGLDTFSEQLPELIDKARRLAIQDARHKAQLVADELGWRVKRATSVTLQEGGYAQAASQRFGHRGASYDPGARPDQTTHVDAAVTITFEFEPR